VQLNQSHFKRLTVWIDFSLPFTPGIKAAAVDFEHPTTVRYAITLAQLIDQRE
jgi:hypothetical protein